MEHDRERRYFSRFPLDLTVDVEAATREGGKHRERTRLVNISAGGARLITGHPDIFFPGQTMTLAIHLPETDEVKAYMSVEATVVRTDDDGEEEPPDDTRRSVTVRFETPLKLDTPTEPGDGGR